MRDRIAATRLETGLYCLPNVVRRQGCLAILLRLFREMGKGESGGHVFGEPEGTFWGNGNGDDHGRWRITDGHVWEEHRKRRRNFGGIVGKGVLEGKGQALFPNSQTGMARHCASQAVTPAANRVKRA